MARAVLEMHFLNQLAGASVQSSASDILRNEFVVVKHMDQRFPNLKSLSYLYFTDDYHKYH